MSGETLGFWEVSVLKLLLYHRGFGNLGRKGGLASYEKQLFNHKSPFGLLSFSYQVFPSLLRYLPSSHPRSQR